MKKSSVLFVFFAAVAAMFLGGCAPLVGWLHAIDEEGNNILVQLPPVYEFGAPNNALITFEGGGGLDEKNSFAEIYLRGVEKPMPVRIRKATKAPTTDAEKSAMEAEAQADFDAYYQWAVENGFAESEAEKSAAVIVYATAAAIAATGQAVAVIRETSEDFDVVLPSGYANVVKIVVKVVGAGTGEEVILTAWGRASYEDVEPDGEGYHLSTMVSPAGSGGIAVDPEQDSYEAGQEVNLEAVPNEGWEFSHWTVNGNPSDWTSPEASVRMDSDVLVVAVFKQKNTPPTTDTVAPVITLNDQATITLTVGQSWNDPGATAVDNVDGSVAVSVSGAVNTTVAGTYTIVYTAVDRAGNSAIPVNRTIIVGSGPVPTGLVVNLNWNATNSQLSFSATGASAGGVVGLELYHNAGGAPWTERETFAVNSLGQASGLITKFRYTASRILRFSVVTNPTSGGYVPTENVTAIFNGVAMPLVNDGKGNWAFQVTVP